MIGADESSVTDARDAHAEQPEWLSALMPLALLLIGAATILGTTYWLLVIGGP